MQDDDFEWDDEKSAQNVAGHGVSFEAARLAFSDAFAVAREDRRQNYGEDRFICSAWFKSACSPSATPCATSGCASSRRAVPSHENDDATMKKTAKRTPKIDWSRADAMTAKQRRTAAWADPDNKPMTDAEWRAAPRMPQVSIIRRALKLSQEDFAAAFHFPSAHSGIGSSAVRRRTRQRALICA
jgi:DNA-binding transcriptional regulator YiaG